MGSWVLCSRDHQSVLPHSTNKVGPTQFVICTSGGSRSWWRIHPRMQHGQQGCHPCALCWRIPVWLPGRKATLLCGTGGCKYVWEVPGSSCKDASQNASPCASSHSWERGLPCLSCSATVWQSLVCCTELWGWEQLTPAEPHRRNCSGAKDFLAHHGKCQSVCKSGTVHGVKYNWRCLVGQDLLWKGDTNAQRSSVLPLCARSQHPLPFSSASSSRDQVLHRAVSQYQS